MINNKTGAGDMRGHSVLASEGYTDITDIYRNNRYIQI